MTTEVKKFKRIDKRLGCSLCAHHHIERIKNGTAKLCVHLCGAANDEKCSINICPYKEELLKYSSYEEYFKAFNNGEWPII